MRATRRLRYLFLALFLYVAFCAVGGIYLADGTLHPGRRPLTEDESAAATTIPVLLIHGQVDSNIPVRHSRLIHARAPKAQLWEVPGADPCGAVSTAPQEFERRVLGGLRVTRSS